MNATKNFEHVRAFLDFFTDSKEYPKDIAANPLPMGTLYDFVSNQFLDGFINYVTIKKAYAVAHYESWTSAPRVVIQLYQREPLKTLEEKFDEVIASNAFGNSTLYDHFETDILILSKIDNFVRDEIDDDEGTAAWMFFWYNGDNSDCCIGRFKTELPEQDVIKRFEKYVQNIEHNVGGEKEIPLTYFQGWIKS